MSDIATTYRITNDENNRYIRNDNGNKVHQYISEHTMLSEQNTYALSQEISGLELQVLSYFLRYLHERDTFCQPPTNDLYYATNK
jgi:hypothetical protein